MRERGESTLTTPTPRLLDIADVQLAVNVSTSPTGTYLAEEIPTSSF